MTSRQQIEFALLGCVLEQNELIGDLKEEWFDDVRIASLLVTIRNLITGGKPVDPISLFQSAPTDQTLSLIQEAQTQCHSPHNFSYWQSCLVDFATRDKFKKSAQTFLLNIEQDHENTLKYVSELEAILGCRLLTDSNAFDGLQCATTLTEDLEVRCKLEGKHSGLVTGFSFLDRLMDGLQGGEVTILAARPSIGKTALGVNIAEKLCLRDGVPTLFLSLEMSAKALLRRFIACSQQISMTELRSGQFSERDFQKIGAFNTLMKRSPLTIVESFSGMTGGEAASLVRRHARKGVKLVVIDYLQKLRPDKKQEKRTYEVADSSASIMGAVKQSGVACICLAQLNRESEKDKGRLPRLSDLADSGQIERDADNVLLLHRDRAEPTEAKLIVAKQRDGETGMVELFFDGKFCKFSQLDKNYE